MTKEELEKYARENRKRLDEQEVKLGDEVKVLVGQFAGETGVIVSISACRNDYTDPYYEADMNCEVPEKYKCRKTLITPNNVIGGLSATDFEVIGNRAPKQPSMEIKQGDKVRVSKDTPKLYTEGWSCNWLDCDLYVTQIDGDAAEVKRINDNDEWFYLSIPCKYLIKVDAEAKEPKFKKGDKVRFKKVYTVVSVDDGQVFIDSAGNHIDEDCLELYTEPTAPTIKVGDRVEELVSRKSGMVLSIEGDIVVVGIPYAKEKHYWHIDSVEPVQPTEQTEAEKQVFALGERVVTPYGCGVIGKDIEGKVAVVLESGGYCGIDKANKILTEKADTDWDVYTANLAKEIALKVANKYSDPTEAAEYAVSVAKAAVEGLKGSECDGKSVCYILDNSDIRFNLGGAVGKDGK